MQPFLTNVSLAHRERMLAHGEAQERSMAGPDHDCRHCHPESVIVPARSRDHAIAMVRRAHRVMVNVRIAATRTECFEVTKKEAIKRLRDMPSDRMPLVNLHLRHNFVFIGRL